MRPEQIKANLNRPVRFTNPRLYIENAEYILTGAVFRLGGAGVLLSGGTYRPDNEKQRVDSRAGRDRTEKRR